MTNREIICANPACRVSETGMCLEGLPLDDCSSYGNEPAVEDEADEAEHDVEEIASSTITLSSGRALSAEIAAKFLLNWDSRVIAIIGPRETGKTSLVAGIYDLFQSGRIGEINFARSSTLTAFEIACHDARTASRRGVPHSERTRRGEVLFYHLDVYGGVANDGVTLLLADRSGEEYSEVADDIANANGLVELHRADVITILVDGARLLDAGRRHSIRMDITMILQGLSEADVLRVDQRIALVLTKLDMVETSENSARAISGFDEIHQHLVTKFAGKVQGFDIFKVAASPQEARMARGTGLKTLLESWLKKQPCVAVEVTNERKPTRAFARIRPLNEEQAHE